MHLKYIKNKSFESSFSITPHLESDYFEFKIKNKSYFMEGSFFYCKDGDLSFSKFRKDSFLEDIRNIMQENNPHYFKENVEGIYSFIEVDYDTKRISFYNDSLERREIYYLIDGDYFYASNNLSDLIGKRENYDENAVLSTLLLTYPPKKHTLYSNIMRLSHQEFIEIIDDCLNIQFLNELPIQIREMNEDNIEEYRKILENSILSRSSESLNVVQLSAGWDSTFLLSILRSFYPAEKVETITWRMIQSNKEVFNEREIERVKKISNHFGVKCHIVDVDFSDESFCSFWKENAEEIVKNEAVITHIETHFAIDHYFKNEIKSKNEDSVLFNGETCDSLHNFGFSQGVSMLHESRAFREYADKMSIYIYSPTFYSKILDDSYKNDLVYKIMRGDNNYYKGNAKERVFEWLFEFVFRKSIENNFLTPGSIEKFKTWLKDSYFGKIIDNINPQNLYYWLNRVYLDFHLQGTNISKIFVKTPDVRMPYYDYNMFKFLASMPEDWGRNLEMNPTKYPMKKIIKSGKYNFPFEIFSKGVSSYTSEFNPNVSWHDEFMRKSTLSSYLFESTNLKEKTREIFSSDYFDISSIYLYIKNARDKPIDGVEFNLLLTLTHSR